MMLSAVVLIVLAATGKLATQQNSPAQNSFGTSYGSLEAINANEDSCFLITC